MYNPIEINSKFIELVKKNPDLPIFAWVNYEVCVDDSYSCWLGEICNATVEEYISIEQYGEDRIFIKDDIGDIIEYYMDENYEEERFVNMSDDEYEQYWTDYVNNLTWKKSIFIWVETPDNV